MPGSLVPASESSWTSTVLTLRFLPFKRLAPNLCCRQSLAGTRIISKRSLRSCPLPIIPLCLSQEEGVIFFFLSPRPPLEKKKKNAWSQVTANANANANTTYIWASGNEHSNLRYGYVENELRALAISPINRLLLQPRTLRYTLENRSSWLCNWKGSSVLTTETARYCSLWRNQQSNESYAAC